MNSTTIFIDELMHCYSPGFFESIRLFYTRFSKKAGIQPFNRQEHQYHEYAVSPLHPLTHKAFYKFSPMFHHRHHSPDHHDMAHKEHGREKNFAILSHSFDQTTLFSLVISSSVAIILKLHGESVARCIISPLPNVI